MGPIEIIALKALATIAILAALAGCLTTIFRVVVVGQYWDTAPIFLTLTVAGFVPLAALWAAARLTLLIWKVKK